MKLQQIQEAGYAAPPIKKSLGSLMQFFAKEETQHGQEWDTYVVKSNYVVRNTAVHAPENEIYAIEFAYANNLEASDHALITYTDHQQDDKKITEIVEDFAVFETRQVY